MRTPLSSSGSNRRASLAKFTALFPLFILSILSARKNSAPPENDSGADWPYYGHDAGGMRYSPLKQISRQNVATLKVAWTFHTDDISEGRGDRKRSGFETTPLLVDGPLHLPPAFNRLISPHPQPD